VFAQTDYTRLYEVCREIKMFPFLTIGFPLSYISLGFGFLIGMGITFATISLFAFCILILGVYSGMIRIKPFLHSIHSISRLFFPNQETNIHAFAKKMFQVKYVGKEPLQKKQRILLFHPHGAFSVSYFFHRMTPFTDWPKELQGGKSCVLRHLYWIPFGEEILDSFHAIPNRYSSMKEVLKGGENLSVIPGGIREMYDTVKGKLRVKILQRTGVFRLALETGTPLQPVLTYGENELYELYESPYFNKLQNWLTNFDCILPIPSWSSIQKWVHFILGLQHTPLQTVIGDYIEVKKVENPSIEDIHTLRNTYIAELQQLYAKTKPQGYIEELEVF
jgi:hypothetical protein